MPRSASPSELQTFTAVFANMHGPDLHLRRDTALAEPAARRPGRGLLGASVGIALASCTLAQQDFEPVQVGAPAIQPVVSADGGAVEERAADEVPLEEGPAEEGLGEEMPSQEGPPEEVQLSAVATDVEPSCDDGLVNQDETGPDCGGAVCPRCPRAAACRAESDCEAGLYCASATLLCTPVSCEDGEQNGVETGVDCGGGCPGCEVGAACAGDADCASGSCLASACAEPSCGDGVKNGDESDADCGGECDGCGAGLTCVQAADCASNVCGASSRCEELCSDGTQSGDESATDCGGSETGCPRCTDGRPCNAGSDCVSGRCDGERCISCADGVENGDEGGLDCGSSEPGCPACPRCDVEDAIDLGGAGAVTALPAEACARITAFPGYAPGLVDCAQNGAFPISFSWSQACTEQSGTGVFEGPFDRVPLSGLGVGCPVLFDFAGAAGPFEMRWF